MADEEPILQPDWGAIAFPSDRITIGQMRQRQPDLFDGRAWSRHDVGSIEAVATLWLERRLASKAFAAAVGKDGSNESDALFDRRSSLRLLNDDYQRYGISSGKEQTRELVRRFEAEAARQGKQARGSSR